MTGTDYVETIDADLEELIPRFMENTLKEVAELRQALEAGDFDTAKRLGHSTKGAAFGYGFNGMGEIGLKIEAAAGAKDKGQVETLLAELDGYIENVKIVYE